MKVIAKSIPEWESFIGPLDVQITHNKGNKLFAVTRDIKVGDEFIDLGEKHICTGHSKSDDWNLSIKDADMINYTQEKPKQETCSYKDECYKILGELSPQATFVKDGDEIDIELYVVKDDSMIKVKWDDNDIYFVPHPDFSGVQRIKYLAKVKCPTCNTYH